MNGGDYESYVDNGENCLNAAICATLSHARGLRSVARPREVLVLSSPTFFNRTSCVPSYHTISPPTARSLLHRYGLALCCRTHAG